MTSRRFFYGTLSFLATVIAANVGWHYHVNTYGIFGNVSGTKIQIYANDRFEKTMLAYNYIPANFSSILIGPSTVTNINTANIHSEKIYNLGINGGNISELSFLLQLYMEKRIPNYVIIGFYPILFNSAGMLTNYISDSAKFAAFGSVDLFKRYFIQFFRSMTKSNPYNEFGHHHYLIPSKKESYSPEQLANMANWKFNVFAWLDFRNLLLQLQEHQVKIIFYFHPIPYPSYSNNKEKAAFFEKFIFNVLPTNAIIYNFNTPEYEYFTSDELNYQDDRHLSDRGAAWLERFLDKLIRGTM